MTLREKLAHAFQTCAMNPGKLLGELAPLVDELAGRVEALEVASEEDDEAGK